MTRRRRAPDAQLDLLAPVTPVTGTGAVTQAPATAGALGVTAKLVANPRWEVVERETEVYRFNLPREPDADLVDAIRLTMVTGKALALDWADYNLNIKNPVSGLLYREGINLHGARKPDGRAGVHAERDYVTCDRCGEKFDIITRLALTNGKERLRRRDQCPKAECPGHVQAKRRMGDPEGRRRPTKKPRARHLRLA